MEDRLKTVRGTLATAIAHDDFASDTATQMSWETRARALRRMVERALSELPQDGYVVVPREPSEAMIRDGHAAAGVWRASDDACWLSAEDAVAAYRAMIAASEKP